MKKTDQISAGLALYKIEDGIAKILLGKSGGPYFYNKPRCYGFPKGGRNENENLLDCAKREFVEETGLSYKEPFIELPHITLKNGKQVYIWLFEGEFEGEITSNMFTLEYPKNSGEFNEYPEMISADLFTLDEAKDVIFTSQIPLLDSIREVFKILNIKY
jgi:predicted NUDIX family NTP pyrophosphohydrolase